MAKSHRDFIPQNAAQFNNFFKNIVQYVQLHRAEWQRVTTTDMETISAAYAEWYTAYALTIPPHTPVQTLARQEAYTQAVRTLRAFIAQFLRFPPVTDEDRRAMGIPNHDHIRTDHMVVTEKVDFVIHPAAIRELSVDFWIQGSDHKAKPSGYDGAVIIWGFRDTPPEHPDELTHHLMASRRPFILHFEETERGKTVWIALAWQNERGITGAWSEFKSAIVP